MSGYSWSTISGWQHQPGACKPGVCETFNLSAEQVMFSPCRWRILHCIPVAVPSRHQACSRWHGVGVNVGTCSPGWNVLVDQWQLEWCLNAACCWQLRVLALAGLSVFCPMSAMGLMMPITTSCLLLKHSAISSSDAVGRTRGSDDLSSMPSSLDKVIVRDAVTSPWAWVEFHTGC